MKKCIVILVISLVLFTISANAQKIELLQTGQFHGEEVSAETGEMWLGLYKKGETYTLLPSVLTIQLFHDAIVDQNGEMSGKEVKIAGQGEPLFLLKGGNFIQGITVKTLLDKSVEITNGFDKTYNFADKIYNLKLESETTKKDENQFIQNDSKLILSVGKTKQVLYEVKDCSFCHWQINWIGDLDNDGKLDFYLFLTDHYNVANQKLFLSTQAGNGKLVKEVAEFTTTGC